MRDPSPFTQQGSHPNSLHDSGPAGEVTEKIPPVGPASLDFLKKNPGQELATRAPVLIREAGGVRGSVA